MEVLGNSILSRNFMYSGLLLNDKGLYYEIIHSHKGNSFLNHKIFITDVELQILDLMDIDPDEWYNHDRTGEDQDVFVILINSPWFNLNRFIKVKKPGKNPMYDKFATFINANQESVNTKFERITIERIEEKIDIPLTKQIKEFEDILKKYKKRKMLSLQGKTVLDALPDYDRRNLATAWPKMMESFTTRLELMKFLSEATAEDVVKRFVKVNELNYKV